MEPSSAPWRLIEPVDPDPPSPAPADGGGQRPWVAIGAVVLAIVVALAAFAVAGSPTAEVEVDGAGVETGATRDGTAVAVPSGPPELVVEVGGAVVRPGVYRVDAGARIADAIAAAGGFSPRVDVPAADLALNLAAPLRDGDEVHVPVRGETAASGTTPGGGSGPTGGDSSGRGGTGAGALIDVNTASADALDTLPGVGPATAAKIIAAREEQRFASVEDLGARKVVGPATLEKIRALVTVGP